MGARRRIVLLREGRTFSFGFYLDGIHEVGFLLAWRLDGALVFIAFLSMTFGDSNRAISRALYRLKYNQVSSSGWTMTHVTLLRLQMRNPYNAVKALCFAPASKYIPTVYLSLHPPYH